MSIPKIGKIENPVARWFGGLGALGIISVIVGLAGFVAMLVFWQIGLWSHSVVEFIEGEPIVNPSFWVTSLVGIMMTIIVCLILICSTLVPWGFFKGVKALGDRLFNNHTVTASPS